MIGGQAIWLLFVWAWLFGQVVARDRTAGLHELVLSAPVSLPALLAGRYLGARTPRSRHSSTRPRSRRWKSSPTVRITPPLVANRVFWTLPALLRYGGQTAPRT